MAKSGIGYSSAHAPLLTLLHERLTEIEDELAREQDVYSTYGVSKSYRPPPNAELQRRLDATSETFEAVLEHVESVDELVEDDYVAVQRVAVGRANGLFTVPQIHGEELKTSRLVKVPSSTILANSGSLKMVFPPRPSCEVLVQSRILANSSELRMLEGCGYVMD